MGCTSSAPNTLSTNGNLADDGIQIIEESNQSITKTNEGETDGDIHTAVLPMCDVVETIVKNNKSSASLQFDNECKENENVNKESKHNIETPQDAENEEKLSKLEEVVEKVVEINQNNDDPTKEDTTEISDSNGTKDVNTNEDQTSQDAQKNVEEENKANVEEENSEESSDQSEFSHATRWEALADIVAELPPSLAIDPVTGQIYSLTK